MSWRILVRGVNTRTRGRWLAVVSVVVISAVALVTYHPILNIGFFAEDYVAVDLAARMTFPKYMSSYLEQCVSAGFCRPAQGIGIWLEYVLFGNNLAMYRVVQLLLHLANCLLFYLFVARVAKKWRVALLATLVYCGLPEVVQAFFWFNVSDQAASFYYLVALLFWLKYLTNKRKRDYFITAGAFILSLANKEIGITVPAALFLMDLWIVREPGKVPQLIRRYFVFGLICILYVASLIPRLDAFTNRNQAGLYAGLGFGMHSITNLGQYLTILAFPWLGVDQPRFSITALLVALSLLYAVFYKRDTRIAFLSVLAILPLLPVLTFTFVGMRYLYQSLMASTVFLAGLFEFAINRLMRWRVFFFALAVVVGLTVYANATTAAEAFNNIEALSREYRLPLRPIFQRHIRFGDDTYVYFLNSPIPTGIASGMFAMRYGPGVSVGGTDQPTPPDLALHRVSIVYYFDDHNRPVELPVNQELKMHAQPAPPVDFSIPIRLEGFDVVNAQVKRGQSLGILLYWKTLARMDKDYTLFAHLVRPNGDFVAGSDSQPQGGKAPTSSWHSDSILVDWVALPVPDNAPIQTGYRLEIGWYDLRTMERAKVVDAQGQSRSDTIVIQPFSVLQ